ESLAQERQAELVSCASARWNEVATLRRLGERGISDASLSEVAHRRADRLVGPHGIEPVRERQCPRGHVVELVALPGCTDASATVALETIDLPPGKRAVERRGRFEDRGRESSLRLGEVDDVAAWFEGAARRTATEIA